MSDDYPYPKWGEKVWRPDRHPESQEIVEIRWRCPGCNKGYASKYTARKHIAICKVVNG